MTLAITPVAEETISAADAKNHIGENATVCGKVASERTATGSRGELLSLLAIHGHRAKIGLQEAKAIHQSRQNQSHGSV